MRTCLKAKGDAAFCKISSTKARERAEPEHSLGPIEKKR